MPETEAAATPARASIRRLPDLLINQIAAGEVVDRPASVVKEFIDNALDAGARRILVELERGGIDLVRVTDDGAGIPEAELPEALAPHSTSKVREADDLDRIATMGFRGEALASIASVARVAMTSRPAEQAEASRVEAAGEDRSAPTPASAPVGTCVEARTVFFNTPARRKFLKTPQTEQGHCLDVVRNLAMSHPGVGFEVRCDGRRTLDLPPGAGPHRRSLELLGRELEGELIEFGLDAMDDDRGLALWGLAGRPSIARATPRAQHLFLNGRPIRDRTVQHAIREAYRGLIAPGRFPTIVLLIEMPPNAVDVNVHPAKTEVRFRDQSLVHGSVLRTVRDALRAADLTPAVQDPDVRATAIGDGVLPGGALQRAASQFIEPGSHPRPWTPPTADASRLVDALRSASVEPTQAPPTPPESPTLGPMLAPALTAQRFIQIHDSYLVAEDEEGLLIIDQHALHERVMFERLLERVTSSALESQRLLMPALLDSTPARLEAAQGAGPLLKRLGIRVEPISPTSLAVQSFPTFLLDRGVEPGPFCADLLDRAGADGFEPDSEAALHETLDMMSCKAAVKAGDALTPGELEELLALRERVERSSNCPHGRPTSIRLSLRELERRFGRT